MSENFFRGVWVIAYRELMRLVMEPTRIVVTLATPLLFLVMFGGGFSRIVGDMAPGVDFVKFMYPGILAMAVVMPSLFSGLSIVWDREFGFLREILVAPISRSGIVVGKALGGGTMAMIQAMFLLILAPLLGVHIEFGQLVSLVPLLLLLSMTLSGLGILVASRMKSQQGFQLVMQLLLLPLMFLSGVFFPVNDVPAWLAAIAKINPVTYGVDAIRQVMLTGAIHSAATGVGGLVVDGPGKTLTGRLATNVMGTQLFGHSLSILEEGLFLAALATVLISLAACSFGNRE
ncbi:MAG: ABC transporter permease [Cyanobacteria bacterium NC_groundwater_1444_Ag_S-0.65um_54_12]|nr:ABC transporter permease [Cyanobacteria bacterium NC_groundwater_1444_Ag_S-0.65um_54_12]